MQVRLSLSSTILLSQLPECPEYKVYHHEWLLLQLFVTMETAFHTLLGVPCILS